MLKLYYANINLIENQKVFDLLFEKMNMQRRDKILRCKNEKDKLRSLMVGYVLRTALEKEGYIYDLLEFSKDEKGKPILNRESKLFFSLSHAGDYGVCVISDRQVGVDIETTEKPLFQTEKEDKLIPLAKHTLTQDEWDDFASCRSKQQVEAFLQYWTRKESFSKAVGLGMGMEFHKISTISNKFWTKWIQTGSCVSIYVEDGSFEDLQIEEITSL